MSLTIGNHPTRKVTTPACLVCGKVSEIEVDAISFSMWKEGKFIQDAFPFASPEERDFLKYGLHEDPCSEIMYAQSEEGEEDGATMPMQFGDDPSSN